MKIGCYSFIFWVFIGRLGEIVGQITLNVLYSIPSIYRTSRAKEKMHGKSEARKSGENTISGNTKRHGI